MKNISKAIQIVSFSTLFIIWGCLVWNQCSYYNYRYFTVFDWPNFLFTIAVTIVPIFPAIGGFIFSLKNRKLLCYLSLLITVILLPVTFLFQSACMLYYPSAQSHTTDPNNFGIYDERVQNILRLNPVSYFPESIPNDSQNVQYQYSYSNYASEEIFISVSWQCSEEHFQEEFEHFMNNAVNKQYIHGTHLFFAENYTDTVRPYVINAVSLNVKTHVITYIISHSLEWLETM